MKNLIEIRDKEHFNEVLEHHDNVVVDFHALDWCVPCQKFLPHYRKAAENLPEVVFLEVDIDKNPWVTSEYGVRGVPTVIQIVDSTRRDIKSRAVVPLIRELTS